MNSDSKGLRPSILDLGRRDGKITLVCGVIKQPFCAASKGGSGVLQAPIGSDFREVLYPLS